ncbi:SDR family oxidoreductase [Microbacterium sp. DT81.1]|uniref:SDR family oxidoreductase n=1 Tax=Microbacterium sp. DT81.1 TaxID=3393413 RepID=UPI003CF60373
MTDLVVIAGASSEIGRAIAVSFAGRGMHVRLWGRDVARLDAAASACMDAGAESAQPTVVDVRDGAALHAAADGVLKEGGRLTAVVWAAGVFQWGRFDTVDESLMNDVLSTTFTAAATTARLFLPALVAHAPSTFVFVGSGAGRQAYPDNAAYVAAKHGLRGLAEALHLDVCDEGVTVSVISAGLVNAGAGSLAPAARTHASALLRPEDIARAVEFVVDSPANVCPTEIVLRPATRHA